MEKSRIKKEELEQEVDFQSRQWTNHALNMMQKNRMFKLLEKDLINLKSLTDDQKKNQITHLK